MQQNFGSCILVCGRWTDQSMCIFVSLASRFECVCMLQLNDVLEFCTTINVELGVKHRTLEGLQALRFPDGYRDELLRVFHCSNLTLLLLSQTIAY